MTTLAQSMSLRPTHCEACGRPLSPRGLAVTGLCAGCRSAGSAFAAAWAEDLVTGGATVPRAAEILGTTTATVRARLHERRSLERAA